MLHLQDVTFGYSRGKKILNACTFELEPGRIYALMGANGAGKTTLFNLITGFLRIQGGNITYKGLCLNRLRPYQINRLGVGRTFQDLRIITKLTVQENIHLSMPDYPNGKWFKALLPPYVYRSELTLLEAKARDIVSRFFLDSVSGHLAGEISFGQQKLLTIASCVASGAEMLLLDEPVAGINSEYQGKVVNLLKELKRQGKTILLIEHNTDFISRVADTIYFMAAGSLTRYETLTEMKADPKVLEAYIL